MASLSGVTLCSLSPFSNILLLSDLATFKPTEHLHYQRKTTGTPLVRAEGRFAPSSHPPDTSKHYPEPGSVGIPADKIQSPPVLVRIYLETVYTGAVF
jgi:hypothetical protein